MNNISGKMRFFNNKYVFLAVNCVLVIAAIISLFGFGTVQKASSLLELTMPYKADLMIVSVYVIIALCAVAAIFLTVKAFMTDNSITPIYICGGMLMFTMIHIISAHISSLILIISLVKEKIDIAYIVSHFPVFEVIFMTMGLIIIMFYAVLNNMPSYKNYIQGKSEIAHRNS